VSTGAAGGTENLGGAGPAPISTGNVAPEATDGLESYWECGGNER